MIHLDSVGSTNDWLASQADTAADGTWVRADTQTGGRGRRGRAWASVPGNLFASVLVRPGRGETPSPLLSFVAAVALDAALRAAAPGAPLALKWPNDVLLDGVKVAGILLEGVAGATIVGFGVNLAGHPADTERPATSLAAAGFAAPSAAVFAERLAAEFADARDRWQTYGFGVIRTAWLARAHGLGEAVEARLGAETVTGRFADLADDGALLLRRGDGTTRAIHAGEVFGL